MNQTIKPKKTEIGEIINQNNIIRYKILCFLYLLNQENKKTSLEGIENYLGLTKNKIMPNLKFLKNEELVGYPENINGEPIPGWGPKGGIIIESNGIKLIEEIELQKNEKKGKIRDWILNNASWIVTSIPKIIEFLKGIKLI